MSVAGGCASEIGPENQERKQKLAEKGVKDHLDYNRRAGVLAAR